MKAVGGEDLKHCLTDNVLQAYFDDELSPERATQASSHLAKCPLCAARAEEARTMLRLLNAALDANVPGHVPTAIMYARLEDAVTATAPRLASGLQSSPSLVPDAVIRVIDRFRVHYSPSQIAVVLAAAALVAAIWVVESRKIPRGGHTVETAGSGSGVSRPQIVVSNDGEVAPGVDTTTGTPSATSSGSGRDVAGYSDKSSDKSRKRVLGGDRGIARGTSVRKGWEPDGARQIALSRAGSYGELLDQETARHVEETQLLFHSIINRRFPRERATMDVSYEKQLSRRLLNNNTLLSRRAEMQGDWLAEEMLSRLEPFLLDIANLPDKPSTDEMRLVKELVRGGISTL